MHALQESHAPKQTLGLTGDMRVNCPCYLVVLQDYEEVAATDKSVIDAVNGRNL